MATHEDFAEFDEVAVPSDRKFGLTVGAVLVAIGAVRWSLGHVGTLTTVLATIGLILIALGAMAPLTLGPLKRGWMALGTILARITSPVVMLLMFLLVFTPIAIGMRLAGRDMLGLRRKPVDESYWKMRPETPHDAASLRLQF